MKFLTFFFAWVLLLGCESGPVEKPVRLNVKVENHRIPLQHGKIFGLYQWNKNYSYESAVEREIEGLGTSPSLSLYFTDLARKFPGKILEANANRGMRTVLSQELCDYHQNIPNVLDSLLAGKWDEFFRNFAIQSREFGQMIYYRFGYEMNGDWVAWGESPKEFQIAWRKVWTIFKEEKAFNVRWVFSPNVLWGDKSFESDILSYYPGDEFVDIVGLDGYNFGDHHSRYHKWKSYPEIFKPSLDGMKKHFPDKPLWITEIGCAPGERKAEWINDFFYHFMADPSLRAFIWFNEDKQYAGEPNWRFDSDEKSRSLFRKGVLETQTITFFSLPGIGENQPSGLPSTTLTL